MTMADELVERSARVASYTQARKRDVERLKKWVDENGCIAKEESRYLGQGKDLFTFSSEDEDPLSRLERSVEDALIPFFKTYYKVSQRSPLHPASRDACLKNSRNKLSKTHHPTATSPSHQYSSQNESPGHQWPQ